jgi:hypothetical protein
MTTELITPKQKEMAHGIKWIPTVGDETQALLDYFRNTKNLSQESCDRLKDEAVRVLSKCDNPADTQNSEKNTGLAFGYIQSGKTMSYTTLIALAKDNKYQIIILIAGITNNLLGQTEDRLNNDLRIHSGKNTFEWKTLRNPDNNDRQSIKSAIDLNRSHPDRTKTILITVLKQGSRLKKLISVLKSIDLQGVPALIIDDEGDQASLNTLARKNAKLDEKGMSVIYSRIIELKDVIPHHTLIQYTATPQAPIFVNILDRLSPKFIELLNPGEDYVGGKEFFEKHSELIYQIPAAEIYDKDNQFEAPPETLLESLRLFFLCVALGVQNRDLIKSKNVSMLVHPSHLTTKHNIYHTWITRVKTRWLKILKQANGTDEKKDLLSEFSKSYEDLLKNNPALPPFDKTVQELNYSLESTEIHELNTKTGTTDVEWDNNYSHILVGGQVMDRGFTVEGLIVTYMPRGVGVGNADTIQQRARFFGYKRKYLSLCRVFLGADTKDAYEQYLLHEENLREIIQKNNEAGKSITELRRKVILSPEYRPTRPSVISGEITKYRIGDWIRIKAPHDSNDIIKHNQDIIGKFKAMETWQNDQGNPKRTPIEIHHVTSIPLKKALSTLLNDLHFTRESDAFTFTQLMKSLNEYEENHKTETCLVYLMSRGESRDRKLSVKNEINQLFQGQNPKTGKGEIIYPGDSEIKKKDQVCIQIHKLNLKDRATGTIKFKDVYTIAVWLPETLGRNYQELIE